MYIPTQRSLETEDAQPSAQQSSLSFFPIVWLLPALRLCAPLVLQLFHRHKMILQGGSVMIASNKPPHLQGLLVMSKVQMSRIRSVTPYCSAARKIPGVELSVNAIISIKLYPHILLTNLSRAFAARRYLSQRPWRQNRLQAIDVCQSRIASRYVDFT